MLEKWRSVIGFWGYQVSNLGRVKSLSRLRRGKSGCVYYTKDRVLKCTVDPKTGYLRCVLYKDSFPVNKTVHSLVADAFLPPKPSPLHTVDHDDGNRINNIDTNLKWSTHSDQRETARKNGTLPVGEKHYLAFLTDDDIEYIRRRYVKGDRENGGAAIARMFGCDRSTINKIMAGINRKNTVVCK
jgi:NUMOD4 motif